MWRLWNKIFGWNFVHAEASIVSMIRKIRYTNNGRAYIKWFGSEYIWLDSNSKWKITPLTKVEK